LFDHFQGLSQDKALCAAVHKPLSWLIPFHDEPRQMILRQPFFYRRRKKVLGLAIDWNESAHAWLMGLVIGKHDFI
jgi:hypothetical protein